MKNLNQLYSEHSGKVSDKWSLYLREYDRLFSGYRNAPISLLEIGIQNGGSMEVYAQYFVNARTIIGCDINPDCAELRYEDPRIEVVVGNAIEENVQRSILSISESFDIIIDDGSHTSADIIRSFVRYFPFIADGGLFVVEDIHCSYWSEFDGGLYHPYSSMSFFKVLTDVVNQEHWGIDKAAAELLSDYVEKYELELDSFDFGSIHSIEFINSLCIVRKAPHACNSLGNRIISGGAADIVPEVSQLPSAPSVALDQTHNPWTARRFTPMKEIEVLTSELAVVRHQSLIEIEALRGVVSALRSESGRESESLAAMEKHLEAKNNELTLMSRELDAKAKEMEELYSSRSWRVTAPLRSLIAQVRRARANASRLKSSVARNGGVVSSLRKCKDAYFKGRGDGGYELPDVVANAELSGEPIEVTHKHYGEWIRAHDTMDDHDREALRRDINEMSAAPLISVIMPVYNARLDWLEEAVRSVQNQLYQTWELCIADDASTDERIRPLLEKFARSDTRIRVVYRESNGHIARASNSALDIARGSWAVLLDQDDVLPEHALYWVAKAITENPDCRLIYSDEDKLDAEGNRCLPFFKPGWSPHLACAQAYIGHLVCFNRANISIGFDDMLSGAQDYDLWLRIASGLTSQQIVHIPKVLYRWRMHDGSTALNENSKSYANEAARLAVQKFVDTRYPGHNISVVEANAKFTYALEFNAVEYPKVSIIIPTKDKSELLSDCIESILSLTQWSNYEIVVIDNRSVEHETFRFFEYIEKHDPRVTVLHADFDFNWSKVNNFGARAATGDVFVFLNNDTKIISPCWLRQMVGYATLPDVGVVGALLYFEDGTIQHSGVVVGMGGWAGHVYSSVTPRHSAEGPYVSPVLTRNVLAVTGACMAISRTKFERLGGFDEEFIICGSDVEICIRAHKAGYYNVLCAQAELYHYESKTRDSYIPEVDFRQSEEKYAPYRVEKIDPFYNENLSLSDPVPTVRID